MTVRNRSMSYLLTVFWVVVSAFSVTFAQDDATEEPLPSKTPTLVPLVPTDEPTSTSEPAEPFTLEEPFIQADLSILSGNVQRPNGMFWHNGNLYISCSGDWTIYEVDALNGSTRTYLWGIRNAHAMYAEDDESGELNIWVPDFQTGAFIRVYQGTTQTIVEQLDGPWGISPIGDDFIVTSLLRNRVVQVTREGEVTELLTNMRSPTGIAVDNEFIYVANNGSSRRAVEWFSLSEREGQESINAVDDGVVQPLITGLQSATSVVLGPDQYLYVAYSLGTRGVIGRVNPEQCRDQGGCSNDEVEIVVYTDLAAPLAGLTIGPDMHLYTHTIFSPDIYYVKLDAPPMSETENLQ